VLIVPQVRNTTNIFIDNINEYEENVDELLKKIGINENIKNNRKQKA
jgi:hypothetical protein